MSNIYSMNFFELNTWLILFGSIYSSKYVYKVGKKYFNLLKLLNIEIIPESIQTHIIPNIIDKRLKNLFIFVVKNNYLTS